MTPRVRLSDLSKSEKGINLFVELALQRWSVPAYRGKRRHEYCPAAYYAVHREVGDFTRWAWRRHGINKFWTRVFHDLLFEWFWAKGSVWDAIEDAVEANVNMRKGVKRNGADR